MKSEKKESVKVTNEYELERFFNYGILKVKGNEGFIMRNPSVRNEWIVENIHQFINDPSKKKEESERCVFTPESIMYRKFTPEQIEIIAPHCMKQGWMFRLPPYMWTYQPKDEKDWKQVSENVYLNEEFIRENEDKLDFHL